MQTKDLLYSQHDQTSHQCDPPPLNDSTNIVHKVRIVYKTIYQIGNNIPKRDKLGIHSETEHIILRVLSDVIRASFEKKECRITILASARISLEVLKNLIRTEYELKIIQEKTYIHIEKLLIEISKMTNGWIKYLETQNPPKEGRLL